MDAFTEVTQPEFLATMSPLDVHPRIVNDTWPYIILWEMQGSRKVVGKKICVGDTDTGKDKYFLRSNQ